MCRLNYDVSTAGIVSTIGMKYQMLVRVIMMQVTAPRLASDDLFSYISLVTGQGTYVSDIRIF